MKMMPAPNFDLPCSLSELSQHFDTLVQKIEQSVTSIDFWGVSAIMKLRRIRD
jgi:hypothetical protein